MTAGSGPQQGALPGFELATPARVQLPFTFIDLFAGIGGFRLALESLGGTCLFSSEWDENARKTYQAWFGGEPPHGDIREFENRIDEIPDHDILTAGFPCQPFSVAGVSKKNSLNQAHGFECERQGNLFFNICDIVRRKRPPVLILENVKNLRSHDAGHTWRVIHRALGPRRQGGLGYDVQSMIINAAGWVPQQRERIYIVCFRDDVFDASQPPYHWPAPPASRPSLKDILEPDDEVADSYTLTPNLWEYLQKYADEHREKGNGFGFGLVHPDRGHEEVTRTLSARYYKDGSEILIDQGPDRNPRMLTPVECARLMGFDEKVRNADDIVVSNVQAYRQFGNAVVPKVVRDIAANALLRLAAVRGASQCTSPHS